MTVSSPDSGNTDTPTVSRWTVDDEAPPDRPTLVLDVRSNDPLFFQWDHRSEITESEWAALVRCVRSDATLTQARELAAIHQNRTLAAVVRTQAFDDLLDLLSEAPDGE